MHRKILETTQLIPEKEKAICDKIKQLTEKGEEELDWNEYELGKICDFKSGKFNTKNMSKSGDYPFYNASVNNPIGKHNEYCFDGDKYILFIKSGGNSKNKISETNGLALPILVKGKTACVMDVIKINITQAVNTDYLYYYLKIIRSIIQENAKYTVGLGHVDMTHFKNMKIRVLKPKIMNKHKLEQLFNEVDNLKQELDKTKAEYQAEIKKFMEPLKNPNEPDYESDESDESDDPNESDDSDNYIVVSPKKSDNKSNKKTEKSIEIKQNDFSDSELDIDIIPTKKSKGKTETRPDSKSKNSKTKSSIIAESDS